MALDGATLQQQLTVQNTSAEPKNVSTRWWSVAVVNPLHAGDA